MRKRVTTTYAVAVEAEKKKEKKKKLVEQSLLENNLSSTSGWMETYGGTGKAVKAIH
jgi:hypothetical protein